MSSNPAKRFSPRFKFQIVLETLKGEKAVGQIARSYGMHPISIHRWKKDWYAFRHRRTDEEKYGRESGFNLRAE